MIIINFSNEYIISCLCFGALVLVSSIFLKKNYLQTLGSSLKGMFGFIMFNIGIATFLSSANELRLLVSEAYGVNAPANTNLFFQEYGIYYVPVIAIGFIIHLLIEKYVVKKDKRIANMGGCHVILRVSLLTTGIFLICYEETNWITVVLLSSIICGLWYSIEPKYVDKLVQTIRGDNNASYGHQTSISLFITSIICKLFKKTDDTEKVNFGKLSGLLRDMSFWMFFLQTSVTVIFGLICGIDKVAQISGTINPWLWLIFSGIKFVAGFQILTAGLRMITTELVPACDKLRTLFIPEAKVAMDVPTLFPFGQNAVVFGAFSGSLTFIILMFIFAKLQLGFIGGATLFFYMVAGGASVYGNKVAGIKGAICAGIITALCMAFGSLLIQRLSAEFYAMEYFCNVCSETDDRLILYPIVMLIGKILFKR